MADRLPLTRHEAGLVAVAVEELARRKRLRSWPAEDYRGAEGCGEEQHRQENHEPEDNLVNQGWMAHRRLPGSSPIGGKRSPG